METTIATKNGALTGFSREGVEALSRSRNEPEWMLQQRLAAWDTYERLPMPTRQDEEWRRTDLRRLKLERYTTLTGSNGKVDSLDAIEGSTEHQMQFGPAEHRAGISVALDASSAYHDVDASLAEKGVIYTDLPTAMREHTDLVKKYFMTQAVPVEFGKFEALHAAMWQTGTFLYVPKGVSVDLPFRSFAISQEPGSAMFTHSMVVLEEGAEAFFVDAFQSETQDDPAFTSAVVELILNDNSKLRYVQVQDWGRHIFNFMTQRAVLQRDAELKSLEVTLGSKFSKNSIGAALQGEGGLAEMLGISFGDDGQFFDHHTWQLHEAPYCTSDLEFKGALKEGARSIFSGMIKVDEIAQRTDAYQQNRNLILDRTSRADSIPNLEIGANDVRCTHGATVSQVVPEHLFYLQARGIPRAEAQKLIVEGFFRPVIDRIPVEEIQEFLQNAIAQKVGY